MGDRFLFRGKRVDDGEWVQGYLSKGRTLGYKDMTLNPCIDREERGVMISSLVDPATIGQCTGLRDKNGALIFEGDIVSPKKKSTAVVYYGHKYRECGFVAKYTLTAWDDLDNVDSHSKIEVVGNIYDNPELLPE